MPFARRNGVRLHYRVLGDKTKPALTMQRGLGRSMSYWMGLGEVLAEDFHVMMMDNRGVGLSDAPRPPYTTAQMADDIVSAMDHAEIPRAHFFGISLGGMIGQWFALRHPDRCGRLILGATTAGGRTAKRVPISAAWGLAKCAGKPLADAMEDTAKYTIGKQYLRAHPEIITAWADIARAEPTQHAGLIGQTIAGAAHNASRHLKKIKAKTLLITGDDDALIPYQNSYKLAHKIPDARLAVLPGAGHDFPTEFPDETVTLIREFLLDGDDG